MKQCSKCGEVKQLTEFHKSKRYKDGLSRHCRRCESNRSRAKYERNKEIILAQKRAWYASHSEHHNSLTSRWRKEHREESREIARRSYYKHHSKNIDRVVKWRKKNPEKFSIYSKNNRAMRRGATGKHSFSEWEALCYKYNHTCLKCGKTDVKLTPDHIVPLSKGGTNYIDNIQPLCHSCNSSKNNKTIDYRPQWELRTINPI